jgi:adenosylcobinamide-GDP ribazoletransferase
MKSFVMMLSFFTRIPVKALDSIDEAAYKKGIVHLPAIGLIIGAATGAVSLLALWIGPYIAAFLTLLVYLLLTGGLHADGLADTMDAFGARRGREKTLEILKDSHTGAFGVLALVMLAAGDIAALAGAGRAAWLFPLAGRCAALLTARCFSCARPGGLGEWFVDGVKTVHIIYSVALFAMAAAAAAVDYGHMFFDAAWFAVFMGAFVLAAGLTLLIVRRFAQRIGGVTGDIVGFSVEASQLVFLILTASAQAALL